MCKYTKEFNKTFSKYDGIFCLLNYPNGEVGYKIGITNKTVAHRYRSNKLGRITILKEWSYAEGKNARNAETRILQDFKVYKWTGTPLLTDGNSEIFDRDVLELEGI